MNTVNTKTLIEKLNKLNDLKDPEVAGVKADMILCELLVNLGYSDLVEAWSNVDRWYA